MCAQMNAKLTAKAECEAECKIDKEIIGMGGRAMNDIRTQGGAILS